MPGTVITTDAVPEGTGEPRRCHRLSVVQHQLQDDAGGNRHQNIIAAYLNPMVTTGRGTQFVGTPVIDHVVPVAIFNWKAIALVELMVWACATFVPPLIVARALLILRTIWLACLLMSTILLAAALYLLIATAITAILRPLGEGKASREQ